MTNYLFKKGSRKADMAHLCTPLEGQAGANADFEPKQSNKKECDDRPYQQEEKEE